jgi:hypothetical protein
MSTLMPMTCAFSFPYSAIPSRKAHISLVQVVVKAPGKNSKTVGLPRNSLIFTGLRS